MKHFTKLFSLLVPTTIVICTIALWYLKRKSDKNVRKPRMKLYWFETYRSMRCEWLLAELGAIQDVELVQMNPCDHDQETLAQYRKVHPHGTIPCLQVEDRTTIIESGAICLYLADLYGKLGPDQDKETYYNWLVYAISTLDGVMDVLEHQWEFTDLSKQNTELINKMVIKFQTFGKYFTQFIHGKDYICGDRLTAADCVLGYNIWWATTMRNGALLVDFPEICQYYKRLCRRSAFQRVFPIDVCY